MPHCPNLIFLVMTNLWIFGHAGLEADLEAAELALDCLSAARASTLVIDLADARVLRGVLAGVGTAVVVVGSDGIVEDAVGAEDVVLPDTVTEAEIDTRSMDCLTTWLAGVLITSLAEVSSDEEAAPRRMSL